MTFYPEYVSIAINTGFIGWGLWEIRRLKRGGKL